LCSSVLKYLRDRDSWSERFKSDTYRKHIQVHVKKGIIIIESASIQTSSGGTDLGDVSHQFQRLITDAKYDKASDFVTHWKIREIKIGIYSVLIHCKVDAVDGDDFISSKCNDFDKKSAKDKRDLFFQLITNGANKLITAKKRSLPGHSDHTHACIISKVEQHDVSEVLKCSDLGTNPNKIIPKLFLQLAIVLNQIEEIVNNGTISSESNCFYNLRFQKNGKLIVVPMDKKEIAPKDYNCEHLYDLLDMKDHTYVTCDENLNKIRPRLNLSKRSISTPLNSVASNSQQESIFGKAKPVNRNAVRH
jgi:hypothetical protein